MRGPWLQCASVWPWLTRREEFPGKLLGGCAQDLSKAALGAWLTEGLGPLLPGVQVASLANVGVLVAHSVVQYQLPEWGWVGLSQHCLAPAFCVDLRLVHDR